MSYISQEAVLNAILNMQRFHKKLLSAHSDFGMNFLENLGRRNCIMSQSQEKFVSVELSKNYTGVECDGRPGQPDILIGELGKEIECKLTTRNRSGQISFQTDYETLKSKGSIDYLYFIASDDFEEFAVLHFENLTIENFRIPANGSRGRSQMIKSSCMEKCNILVGEIINNNHINLKKLSNEKHSIIHKFAKRHYELQENFKKCSKKAKKKRSSILKIIENESNKKETKLRKNIKREDYWKNTPAKYSIQLERI